MSDSVETTSTFSVTDKAKQYILEIMEENKIPKNYFLKIAAKNGEQSNFNYQLGFDIDQDDSDTLFDLGEVKVTVDGKSLFYLMGAELDFKNDSDGKGFVFNNPNNCSNDSHSSCGCGV